MDDLERFRPLIERALARTGGTQTWDHVREEVEAGRAMLTPSKSGGSVVVLQPMRDLHVWISAGALSDLMIMESEVAEAARRDGFDRMTLTGREGWRRALKSRGWKPELGLVKEL